MSDELNPIERDLLDGFREFVERLKQESQAEPVTCDRAMALLEQSRKHAAWWEATEVIREMMAAKNFTVSIVENELEMHCDCRDHEQAKQLMNCLVDAVDVLKEGER